MYSQWPLHSLPFDSLLFWDVPQYSAWACDCERATKRACSYPSAGFSPEICGYKKSPCVAGFKALGEVQVQDIHGLISGNCEASNPECDVQEFTTLLNLDSVLLYAPISNQWTLTTVGIWKTVDWWEWGKGEPAMAMATDWLIVLPSPSPSSTITEASRPLWMWFSVK